MKTWFITGASRGLGLEIARAALAAGDQVVTAARKPGRVADALGGHDDRLLPVALDVTDSASIRAAVAEAQARFSRVDVLVNNAGYGQFGAFEQVGPESVARQFATNVFGAFDVTREILPLMRARRSGRILTISSIAGLEGYDGSSIYCSTKFALSGWSEALSRELAPFGVKVTCLYPGRFRTDFLDESSARYGDVAIDDYRAASAEKKATLDARNHRQPGDPAKFAALVLAVAAMDAPPVRLGAGSDALATIVGRAAALRDEADTWGERMASTDFPD